MEKSICAAWIKRFRTRNSFHLVLAASESLLVALFELFLYSPSLAAMVKAAAAAVAVGLPNNTTDK